MRIDEVESDDSTPFDEVLQSAMELGFRVVRRARRKVEMYTPPSVRPRRKLTLKYDRWNVLLDVEPAGWNDQLVLNHGWEEAVMVELRSIVAGTPHASRVMRTVPFAWSNDKVSLERVCEFLYPVLQMLRDAKLRVGLPHAAYDGVELKVGNVYWGLSSDAHDRPLEVAAHAYEELGGDDVSELEVYDDPAELYREMLRVARGSRGRR